MQALLRLVPGLVASLATRARLWPHAAMRSALVAGLGMAFGLAVCTAPARAATLTLEDGVVFKFGAGAEMIVRDRLTLGSGVVLTSQDDDTSAGQTNPVPRTATAGAWRGLRIERSSTLLGPTAFSGATLRFGGSAGSAALTLRSGSATLSSLQFNDNGTGLRLIDGATTQILGTSFARNGVGLRAESGATPVVSGSQFTANTSFALVNDTLPAVVRAEGNWWGDASGPRDALGNPAGRGDAVSAGVNYTGFQRAAPLLAPQVRLASTLRVLDQRDVLLELSCLNANEYRISEDPAFAGASFQPLVDGRAVVSFTLGASDGLKAVHVQFRDAGGATVTATLSDGVLFDSQAPTLTVTSPAEGEVVFEPAAVSASASDGSGIRRVEFHLDGVLVGNDASAPYSLPWDPATLTEGAHTWRVVAVDNAGRSAELTRNVTVSRTRPADATGPLISRAALDGLLLADGRSITRDGNLTLDAVDPSGVARVVVEIDGVVVATALGTGPYLAPLSLAGLTNGGHMLTLRALDSLGNVSVLGFAVVIAQGPPDAPVISLPVAGLVTRTPLVTVSGLAKAGSQVQVLVGGQPAGPPVNAGADGRFAGDATLVQGANVLQARASNAFGTSAPSAAVGVTLDLTVPASPGALSAVGLPLGQVRLTWARSTDPNVVGYELYRAAVPFSDPAVAVKVNAAMLATPAFDDMPPADGLWYYRAVALNANGIASVPGNQAQAVADRIGPRALSVAYTPLGKVDAATGRVGQGPVNVVLTVSEPLAAEPYLALVPAGGAPITIALVAGPSGAGAISYVGSFQITAATPSGNATALFSARDGVGNRGSDIVAGGPLAIDTAGPALNAITLAPASPIRNDSPQTLRASFEFSKPTRSTPQLSFVLSGPLRTPVALTGLVQLSATTWQAQFDLPADAGLGAPESLSFRSQAIDDLDNVSTRVAAPNQFQVYRGNLPPLEVPTGFTATAQPAGKVRLAWQAVPGASLYQIYRQAPGEAGLTPLVRTTGTDHIDTVPADGSYLYAVASVRQSNGQEAVSGQGSAVPVVASASAPGVPQNLNLQLGGQGIVARWQPPAGGNAASYNLYRSGGTSLSSIAGLTPYLSGLQQTTAVDANPSPSAGAYAVTALDAAGNESALSNSAYLNASLLPVKNVRIEQIDGGQPSMNWSAPNGSVSGYLVYAGVEPARVKLTPNPISSLGLTDTGFSAGERAYTIASVDGTGAEMPRAVLLPAVTTQIASGLPLRRGVMNRVQVQMANASSAALDGVRVVVRVPVDGSGAQFAEHRSERFGLASNQTRLVDVVVGGHAGLPASARVQVGVEIAAHADELVKIARSETVAVIDGGLFVDISTDEFTRGATGRVRLTVENTSDVEVELLTATANAGAPSSELRFKLIDLDGNVLATQAYQQALGSGVVTLPGGLTVARIPAGARHTSEAFAVAVPGSSPATVRVRLEVDKLRYHSGQADEVTIAGRGSEKTVNLVDTAYTAELNDVSPVMSFGEQDIVLAGRAIERSSGAALPDTRVKLVFNQQGYERSVMVLTDAAGAFVHRYKPAATDAGFFKVSALHPDATDRPEQKSFTINRVSVGPTPFRIDVPRNQPVAIPFVARTGPAGAATELRYVLEAASQPTGQLPAGIGLQFPPAVTLAERQTVNLPLVFNAGNDAQPSGSLIVDLRSAEGGAAAVGQVRIDYRLGAAVPFLLAAPSLVETGLVQGASQIESVVLKNNGLQDAVNLRVTLTRPDGSPAPAWARLASAADGTLAVGAERRLDLSFAPPADVAAGTYEFALNLAADNMATQHVKVFVSLVPSGRGGVLFKAADIFTATLDKQGRLIPGLAGAAITLQNEDVASISHELVTDAFGEALIQDLPAGRYKFRARAPNHQEAAGRLSIRPGLTLNQPVFLDYTVVTVEWSVREIAIQDRYEVTLNATFETDVPAPVVVLQPGSVNLPRMRAGEVFHGELTLTNYGLVRADNLRQHLPAPDPFFKYEFLAEIPDVLQAKQRVTLPYRIIALQTMDEAASGANSSGGGCTPYSASMTVQFDFVCANGTESSGSASVSWFTNGRLSACNTGSLFVPGGTGSGSITSIPNTPRCQANPRDGQCP